MELNIVNINGNTFCIIPNVNKLNIIIKEQIFNYFRVDGIILEHELGRPIFFEPNGWEIPGCGNGLTAYYFIRKYIKSEVRSYNNLPYIQFNIKLHSPDTLTENHVNFITVNDEPHAVIQHGKILYRPSLVQEYRKNTYFNMIPNPYNRDINTTIFFDAGDKIIQTQTFESGVYKQTPSCGTGSIASAYICNKKRLIYGKRVYSNFLIQQNGGSAYIEVDKDKYYYHAPAKLELQATCKLFNNKLYFDVEAKQ